MKALILAAGRGKRLGDLSSGVNKCLLSVLDRPLIEYSLETAVGCDISEIIIVVGYRAEDIISRYGNQYKNKPVKYAFQKEQHGLVHAIECAKDTIGSEDFILLLGDEFMVKPKHQLMVRKFREDNLFGICGVVLVEDKTLIRKTYSVQENGSNRILNLIEKPEKPFNNKMGTGNCVFSAELFSYIDKTPVNKNRNEKELPDLIQCAINDGKNVESFVICGHYVNVNLPEEIKKAESYFAHL